MKSNLKIRLMRSVDASYGSSGECLREWNLGPRNLLTAITLKDKCLAENSPMMAGNSTHWVEIDGVPVQDNIEWWTPSTMDGARYHCTLALEGRYRSTAAAWLRKEYQANGWSIDRLEQDLVCQGLA